MQYFKFSLSGQTVCATKTQGVYKYYALSGYYKIKIITEINFSLQMFRFLCIHPVE